jgi:hypothetical protein
MQCSAHVLSIRETIGVRFDVSVVGIAQLVSLSVPFMSFSLNFFYAELTFVSRLRNSATSSKESPYSAIKKEQPNTIIQY